MTGFSLDPFPLVPLALLVRSAWMGQWNRRPRRKLQYSPLVENFLRARKYSSVNLVRATSPLGLVSQSRGELKLKMNVEWLSSVNRNL